MLYLYIQLINYDVHEKYFVKTDICALRHLYRFRL